MGGKRLSALTNEAVSLSDDDLLYAVDTSAATNSKSKKITKANFKNTLGIPTNTTSRVVSGGLIWVSGLIYESVNLVYEINGESFTITDGTQVTLDAADGSNDRIDLIYGDDTGALGKSTGTPAASPSANTLPSYQLQLKIVFVATSATEPTGVSTRTVYTENVGQPTEFTATESTSSARIDLANTTTPITGTYDIKTTSALNNEDTITFTHAAATTIANFDYLKFDILLLSAWDNDSLQVELYNSSTLVGTGILRALIDTSNITTAQTITIFKADFTLVSGETQFDKVVFFNRVKGASTLQYQLDNIYVGEDANTTQPISITGSDVSLDTANFGTNLTSDDDNVQKLADAFDSFSASALNTVKSDVTGEPTGSDVVSNIVSLTQSEYDAGSPNASTLYVITDAKDDAEIMFACSDEDSNLTTGTSKFTFRMPYAMALTEVRANVKTAPTGSTIIVDINESGTTILSTKLTIDAGEKTSTTAAVAAVISDSALADDAEITIDIDQVGSTVAGTGLKVTLIGKKA